MKVHLVLYAEKEPFLSTYKKIIESIPNHTSYNIVIHSYNLEKIKTYDWFTNLSSLKKIQHPYEREGYYNAWKPFIVKDVYDQMEDDDILYYTDCSQYYKFGFTENIDILCNIVLKKGFIAGSCGKNTKNNTRNCCNKIQIWNEIIHDKDNKIYLDKMHILNSWFLCTKNSTSEKFFQEWIYYCFYQDKSTKHPYVTMHHTVDQSIFTILAYKYNLHVFYKEDILHDQNKDKNLVLRVVNHEKDSEKYFMPLNDL